LGVTHYYMKKYVIIFSLLVVLSKLIYDVYTFIYDTQSLIWERFFNIAILLSIFYYGLTSTKKPKKACQ
jgi:hypothetical protein